MTLTATIHDEIGEWEPELIATRRDFHMHPELEQAYVLEGSMEDHDGVARAGDFVWRKGQSKHDNTSHEGAVILAVYRKPNLYYHAAGESTGF